MLRDIAGKSSGVSYAITYRFFRDHYEKNFALTSAAARTVKVIEPVVKLPGTRFTLRDSRHVAIQAETGPIFLCSISRTSDSAGFTLGRDEKRYWSPFPAVDCYPIGIDLPVGPGSSNLTLAFTKAGKQQ